PETALETNQGRRGPPGNGKPPSGRPAKSEKGPGDSQKSTPDPGQRPRRPQQSGGESRATAERPNSRPPASGNSQNSRQGTLFVLDADSPKPQVLERKVILGERRNGQVEIIQGLRPGEAFIARSNGPLKEGAAVSPSAISESRPEQE
ncbi:MAG: hypothetical protein WA902_17710, partial [Thermosynechococcaceae cyanobacterium]